MSLGAAMLAALLAAAMVFTGHGAIWPGLVLTPILLLAVTPLISATRKLDLGFDVVPLLYAALMVKVLGTVIRYYVVQEVYDGVADANVYNRWGAALAGSFRRFDFSVDVGAGLPGTGGLRYVTGLVYAVLGANRFTGFIAFSLLAFVGLYLLFRAFVIAVPAGNHRRYALLVMFWPTIVFWPSSIGKEAWMILSLGVFSYGAALLFDERWKGLVPMGIGTGLIVLVRPHMAAMVFFGLIVALVVRRRPVRDVRPISRAALIIAFAVFGSVVVWQVGAFFNVDDLSSESIDEALNQAESGSDEGGSSFQPSRVSNPTDFPAAAVTVLFRPFVFEANNVQALLAATEGVVLAVLVIGTLSRLGQVLGTVRRTAYAVYALGYIGVFIYGFSAVANFGLLARQRTQVLPFVFVLLSLLPAASRPAESGVRTRVTAGDGGAPARR